MGRITHQAARCQKAIAQNGALGQCNLRLNGFTGLLDSNQKKGPVWGYLQGIEDYFAGIEDEEEQIKELIGSRQFTGSREQDEQVREEQMRLGNIVWDKEE